MATNIAESSVTIPKVAFVIDSCRSLQVYWNKSRKKEAAELVWVSKSQVNIFLFLYGELIYYFIILNFMRSHRLISEREELVELVMAKFIGWLLGHFSTGLRIMNILLF